MRDLEARSRTIGLASLLIWTPTNLLAERPFSASREQTGASEALAEKVRATPIVEIRSYNLKPGTRPRFHQLVLREALPMLRRWKMDVVAFGPSLHDSDSYCLIRSFSSLEDRQRREDAFYGSDEWRDGPRDAILADILSYTTVVMHLDDAAIGGLRRTGRGRP